MPLSPHNKDRLLLWSLRACAAPSGLIVFLILAFLVIEATPALQHVGAARFITDARWGPKEYASDGEFNLAPMVAGTLLATLGAIALATPLGVLCAVFRHYYAPKPLAIVHRKMIEVLAGAPSVVYGFWGLTVLAPLIRHWSPPGQSLLAGVIVLTVMILPTVALISDAAFTAVPRAYMQGAAALGLSHWATIRHVVFPNARRGVATGVLLATGRALGETMAVLMVCGNVVQVPKSLFSPIRTLTANIALEMGPALGDHRSALFVSGLLLMMMVLLLVRMSARLSGGTAYG